MRTKLTASLATLALSGAFLAGVAAPSNAATPTLAPAASTQAARATVSSTVPDMQTSLGELTNGVFTPTKFVNDNGTLKVIGTYTATLTTKDGISKKVTSQGVADVTNATNPTTLAAAAAAGSCRILDLTLGPLHLDLLGLVVDLNQVHLTITAQQGSGNLLGNLLCSVANLLNGGTGLTGLANLLNQLLGL